MAKVIVSGNLNQYGNAGQFETDRSTWGFADGDFTAVRSSAQKTAGLYSALSTKLSGSEPWIYGRYLSEFGKKYLIKAKVRVPSTAPAGSGEKTIQIAGPALGIPISGVLFDVVTKTVAEATDTWVDIEASVEHTNNTFPTVNELIHIRLSSDPITGGQLLIDQLEIYEYVDQEEPIVCDLDIDEAGTVVTNESAPAAGDGSIDVDVDGTGTYEYSKDDGANYQPAPLFTGLGQGIYVVKIRDTGILGCEDRYPFAVNDAAVTHDFTVSVTHESIRGLNDGAIVLTPTGTGGPFEFTKDAGATWQAGNNFTGLAPGTYFVAVRNAAGNAVVKVVTVNAGAIDVDKVFHSRNYITVQKAATAGYELLTNYRLYAEVRVEDVADSGTYVTKMKVSLPPDSNGLATFYLRPAFRGVLSAVPPTQQHSAIIRLTDRIKRWKLYTGELQDDEVTPGSLEEGLVNLVVLGGIDKFHFPGLDFFTTFLQANKKFLSWAPSIKTVDRNQEDFLAFYNYGSFTTLKLRVTAYYDDGTDETSTTKTLTGTSFTSLYQIPAGPSNSGANLINPAKNLIRYDLWLMNQSDTVITEVRTYLITKVKHPLTRYLLFLNSLGGYEVMRCAGQAHETAEISKDPIQKFLPHNYSAIDGEFEVNQSRMVRQTNYSTGFIRGSQAEQWHEYIKDLLLSPQVYDITDGRRLPIVITEAEHSRMDQDYNRFVRFTARHAYDDENFTPASI